MGSKIGVIGCGAWPITIAKVCCENGHDVSVWCHREGIRDDINLSHQQSKVLPDVHLPNTLHATCDIDEAIDGAELIILGLASKYLKTLEDFSEKINGLPVVNLAKGLVDGKDSILISDMLASILPKSELAILSGPNLAGEIARQLPSATVIASTSERLAKKAQSVLSNRYFRVYTSTDCVGVELGGVLKNIMAIAAGCLDGLDLGVNAKSALITRGLQEMMRFGELFGAQPDTWNGLSGLGDLIATCTSPNSRNYRVGNALSMGTSIEEITKVAVAEGLNTTRIVYEKAQIEGVDMPITTAIYNVVYNGLDPKEAIHKLMARNLKEE